MKTNTVSVYYFNNCRGRPHEELFGRGAFFDLGKSKSDYQSKYVTDFKPGQCCVVVQKPVDGRLSFDWYRFAQMKIKRSEDGLLDRVFYGKRFASELLQKSHAAKNPRYRMLFNVVGALKRPAMQCATLSLADVDSLEKAGSIDIENSYLTEDEIDEAIWSNKLQIGVVTTDSKLALQRRRVGQDRLRKLTLINYKSRCAVCDIADPNLLVASHIVGWSEVPAYQGRLSNVICLCRFHDTLFEAGYWSLNSDLGILKKQAVKSTLVRDLLDKMRRFRWPQSFPPSLKFIQHHRTRAGFTHDN